MQKNCTALQFKTFFCAQIHFLIIATFPQTIKSSNGACKSAVSAISSQLNNSNNLFILLAYNFFFSEF